MASKFIKLRNYSCRTTFCKEGVYFPTEDQWSINKFGCGWAGNRWSRWQVHTRLVISSCVAICGDNRNWWAKLLNCCKRQITFVETLLYFIIINIEWLGFFKLQYSSTNFIYNNLYLTSFKKIIITFLYR